MKFIKNINSHPNPYTQLLNVLILTFIISSFSDSFLGRIVSNFMSFITVIIIINIVQIKVKFYKIIYRGLALLSLLGGFLFDLQLIPSQKIGLILCTSLINIAFIAVAIHIITKKVMLSDKVTQDTIRGGICIYLLIGVFFAIIYQASYTLSPQSFVIGYQESGAIFNSVYFSFVTLTTLGYGDIIPIHNLVRTLVNLEGIIGTIYPAITLGKLVSLYMAHNIEKK
jgi:hypothetical protein